MPGQPVTAAPWLCASRCAERAAITLRIAYLFPAYWMLGQTLCWREYSIRLHADLLWPVFWLESLDLRLVGPALLVTSTAALLVCGLAPQFRWTRVLGALALTEYLALRFSLGKIHHLMHGWLLVMWLCCGLPVGWTQPTRLSRDSRQRVLRLFHACQLLVATTYCLSGVGKLLGATYQAWIGETTLFHPSSLARHTAARLLETPEGAPLGAWMVRNGHWLWPATLSLLAVQVLAFWMARRPTWHFVLGACLVAFHAMTALTMGIDFTPAMMLCGVLFLASPFTATFPTSRVQAATASCVSNRDNAAQ